ncbi:hypothetical protein F5Y00DRAFT_261047 [Daldinia vernicosa]|uniref:uncharacterized protein n=1 Tax=Daldinia vernicosa TaxID=114800 RepID=UPI00200783AD|nr:uncharacterized protein F5Y00DRAFT_261047 [Daldinia vernicosa]KAI0849939.1 hypothetical protein F5Y00DRAFT_261047 [Daldinia vernicosa]
MTSPARLEEGHEMDAITGSSGEPGTGNNNTGYENFRGDSELKNGVPRGWPSIAAAQLYYPNLSIHRRFSYLLHRVLLDQETKLAYLENQLERLDNEDNERNAARLRSLSFDRETLLISHTRVQAQSQPVPTPTTSKGADEEQRDTNEYSPWNNKDLILESAMLRLKSYDELLLLGKEMQKLPRISRREHRVFFDVVNNRHPLDASACQFLYSNDDFVTTVTDRVHQYFETLIYGDTPITKLTKRIFGRKDEIDTRILTVFLKVVVVFASGVLLLSPVAILLLVSLSRAESFVVVVAFDFAFVAALTWLKCNWETILVGLSAYMAVLVTFLSNLEQGKT